MELIDKYFPEITDQQYYQYVALNDLYHEWNQKINVISRKDIDNLYEHHVLHSLAIAKALHAYLTSVQVADSLVFLWLLCSHNANLPLSMAQERKYLL